MSKPSMSDSINEFNAWTPAQVVQAYGSIGPAAAAMAGVPYTRGVSKNMEYKAARRNLERYLKGRTPNKETQAKLNQAGRKTERGKPIGVSYVGYFKIGGSDRDIDREREINRVYSPEEWDEMSAMAEDGDEQGLWDFIAEEYQVSSMELIDGEILIGED